MQVEEKPCKSIEVVHIIYSQGHNRALLMKIYEHLMICVRKKSLQRSVTKATATYSTGAAPWSKHVICQGTAYVTFRDKAAAMKAGVGRC